MLVDNERKAESHDKRIMPSLITMVTFQNWKNN